MVNSERWFMMKLWPAFSAWRFQPRAYLSSRFFVQGSSWIITMTTWTSYCVWQMHNDIIPFIVHHQLSYTIATETSWIIDFSQLLDLLTPNNFKWIEYQTLPERLPNGSWKPHMVSSEFSQSKALLAIVPSFTSINHELQVIKHLFCWLPLKHPYMI